MKERRRIFAILLSMALVFTYMPVMAFADTGTGNDGSEVNEEIPDSNVIWDEASGFAYECVNSDGMDIAKIVGYKGDSTVLDVPPELGGRPVAAFSINPSHPVDGDETDYYSITEVNLPQSTIYIRSKTLRNMDLLKSVSIEENEFYKSVDGVLYRKYTEARDGFAGMIVACYPEASELTEWVIPEGTIRLNKHLYVYNEALKSVTLATDTDESFQTYRLRSFTNLEAINVPSNNKAFQSIDGVLFSKSQKEQGLLLYPSGKSDKQYSIPEGTIFVEEDALYRNPHFETLIIPESLKYFNYQDFDREFNKLTTISFTGANPPVSDDPYEDWEGLRCANDYLDAEIVYPDTADKAAYDSFIYKVVNPGYADIPENCEALTLGTVKSGTTTSADEVKTYKFTPPEQSGSERSDYVITITRSSKAGDKDLNAVLLKEGSSHRYDSSSVSEDRTNLKIDLSEEYIEEGDTFPTYYVQFITGSVGDYTVKVTEYEEFPPISGSYEKIKLNEEKTVNITTPEEVVTFEFTPAKSGKYVFRSFGDEDAVGRVCTANEIIERNDDAEGVEGYRSNFRIEFDAIAGTTYYMQARMYDDGLGTFGVVSEEYSEQHIHHATKVEEEAPTYYDNGTAEHYECYECEGLFKDKECTKATTLEELSIPSLKETAEAAADQAAEELKKAQTAQAQADKDLAAAQVAAKTPGAAAVAAAAKAQASAKAAKAAAAKAKAAAATAQKAAEAAKAAPDADEQEAAQLVKDANDVAKKADTATTAASKAVTAADTAKSSADAASSKIAAEQAQQKANNGIIDPTLPKVKIKGPKKAKKSFTAQWKKLNKKQQKKVKGIEIEYSLTRDFQNPVFKATSKKKANIKVKKLQSKKTYYVRAHTYVIRNGQKYVSNWSATKKVKVK